MMNRLALILCLVCFIYHSQSLAEDSDAWQCAATDRLNNRWLGFANFERAAKQKAIDECKKNSALPKSCTNVPPCVPPYAYQGKPDGLWVCTALDRNGSPWISTHLNRISAALAARSFCRAKSTIPHTCYINTVTCTLKERGP